MTHRTGPFRIPAPRFTIEGSSRAGVETWFRIRELGIALDVGRCPDLLVGTPNLFISHAHIDHALGVPFYAAQRKLQRLETGNVYVPAETLDDFRDLIRVHERLQDTTYQINLVGLAEGDVIQLRRDLFVRVHRATHRVVTNAYEFIERRHKLKAEFIGLDGSEIERLRHEGRAMTEDHDRSILLYTGDTDRGIFDRVEALFHAEVLIIECTFTNENERDRAEKYSHIHIEDIRDLADRFRNELIVLSHFSLRNSPEEIEREVLARLPEGLRERVRVAI